MALVGESLKYSRLWLADFFHGFVHVDHDFDTTKSTFDPENEKYIEVRCQIQIN